MDKEDSKGRLKLERLEARNNFLEQSNRWYYYSLELLTSLFDLNMDREKSLDSDYFLKISSNYIKQIYDFKAMGFFIPENVEGNFRLQLCHPESKGELLQKVANSLIDKGIFSWSLKSNKAFRTKDSELRIQTVVKSLSTRSKTFGVFIGVVDLEADQLNGKILNFVSILLNLVAYLVEKENRIDSREDEKVSREIVADYRNELERQMENRAGLTESLKNPNKTNARADNSEVNGDAEGAIILCPICNKIGGIEWLTSESGFKIDPDSLVKDLAGNDLLRRYCPECERVRRDIILSFLDSRKKNIPQD